VLFFLTAAIAQTLTLEQIMADPDWMGAPPRNAYWAEDSRDIYFERKVSGEDRHQLWVVPRAGGSPQPVDDTARTSSPARGGQWDAAGLRKVYTTAGDLYVSDARGKRRQLTRTADTEHGAMWTTQANRVAYQRGGAWYTRDLRSGLESQVAELRAEKNPADTDEPDFLHAQQRRLFTTVDQQMGQEEAARERAEDLRRDDPRRVPPPFYLGDDREVRWTSLSPDLKSMLVVVAEEGSGDGERDQMPVYVTRSGYVETERLRRKVGEGSLRDEQLLLVDLVDHAVHELSLDALPGRTDDPLAFLRAEPLTDPRPVGVNEISWHPTGEALAIQLRASDNKDRWIVTVDPAAEAPALQPVHRLTDEAWISWSFNDMGWLPDTRRAALWWQSEETGHANLYLHEGGETVALTAGAREVSAVQASPDGRWLYYNANADHPGVYEVWRVPTRGGAEEQLTALGGRNRYTLSPDGLWLLLDHEETTRPAEVYVQRARAGAPAQQRTDSMSSDFTAIDWVAPELVAVPSAHGAPAIHGRLYRPAEDSEDPRPAVIFIHGAGYMQNAHAGWSYYFREFMFHTLLTQHGYVVLDLDYRASAGYGRDWRTAIYRQMGAPEVEDLLDGAAWLAETQGVDRDRIGLYGGSYGGFLTLMALFNQPGDFAAGAALRPVTDWAHYNHGYTSNILNTPSVDPEAFDRSSPIEFAAGLSDPLLVCHGLMDDNVVAQDVLRLSQRLIELEKQDWELALYPLERHGFTEPSAWLDEYRRIFKLFEAHLKG